MLLLEPATRAFGGDPQTAFRHDLTVLFFAALTLAGAVVAHLDRSTSHDSDDDASAGDARADAE